MSSRLPLNNLNAFARAAQYLSFQKAAEQLHVTPSAVSHQVRNLEQLLGYPLFERLDKRVTLTPRGAELFADIQQPFRQIQEASEKALRGLDDSSLVLSVAPVFATRWLMPRLKHFQSLHPSISLSILATTEMVNFNTDPVDASIRMGAGDWPDLESCLLFQQNIIALCSPQLLNKNSGQVFSTDELLQQTLVQNSSMPNLWSEWFEAQGIKLPRHWKRFEVQNSAQVLETIQSGEGIGLIDRQFIQQDLASCRFAMASHYALQGEGGYFLTYPKTTQDLSSFKRFKQWLLEALD